MSGGGEEKIVVVYRKKKAGSRSHGGSWKVAYADFVTAMMAFFLVMWIVGMDSDVKDLVQGYFNNPIGFRRAFGAGLDPLSQGSSPLASELQRVPLFVRQLQERRFEAVRDDILRDLREADGIGDLAGRVEVVVTPEGLRVELREGEDDDTFFTLGSDEVKPAARRVLDVIGADLQVLPNDVIVEGHTDSAAFGSSSYTNWELSVDRANAARRILVDAGLDNGKVVEVRGYADRHLLSPTEPYDASNRRVTILIPYLEGVDLADPLPEAP